MGSHMEASGSHWRVWMQRHAERVDIIRRGERMSACPACLVSSGSIRVHGGGASGLAGSRHTAYMGKVVQGGAGAFTYGKRSLWDTPCDSFRALAFLGLSEVWLPGARVCTPGHFPMRLW